MMIHYTSIRECPFSYTTCQVLPLLSPSGDWYRYSGGFFISLFFAISSDVWDRTWSVLTHV
jgi:hypothetical protein